MPLLCDPPVSPVAPEFDVSVEVPGPAVVPVSLLSTPPISPVPPVELEVLSRVQAAAESRVIVIRGKIIFFMRFSRLCSPSRKQSKCQAPRVGDLAPALGLVAAQIGPYAKEGTRIESLSPMRGFRIAKTHETLRQFEEKKCKSTNY